MADHHYEESQDHSSTMKRSNPPPHLTLFSPSSSRNYGRCFSSATPSSSSGKPSIPRSAPLDYQQYQQYLPNLRVQPASGEASPERPCSSHRGLQVSHKSSYESFFEPPRPPPQERSESTETVKGPLPTATTTPTTPMQLEAGEYEPLQRHSSPRYGSEGSRYYGSLIDRASPSPTTLTGLMTRTAVNRWMVSSVMHGVTLVIQCIVTFAVISAIVGVTVWKKDDLEADFWTSLWTVTQPTLGLIVLFCFLALVAHELRAGGISTVAMLYIQAGTLVLATIAAGLLAVRCFEQEDRGVKGVALGCSLLVWGTAVIGFARAAIVWKRQGEREEEEERVRFASGLLKR